MPMADPVAHPVLSLLAILLYSPLSLIALLLNLFAIPILAIGHRYFSQKFFYICARHLLVADLLSTLAQVLIAVPVSVMPSEVGKVYVRSSFAQFGLTMETLAHLDTFHFVALQSCAFLPCLRWDQIAVRLHQYGTIIGLVVWMWVAVLMLLFGFVPCAKRFDTATLHFYDTCYWRNNANYSDSLAAFNIWLAALLLIPFFIYASGHWHVKRRIRLVCSQHMRFRQGSISISVVMPSVAMTASSVPASPMVSTNGSPKSSEIADRKRLAELLRLREMLIQGLLITVSLAFRFIGFFVLPWIASTAYGNRLEAMNQRTVLTVLGNTLTLISLASHPIIYWWWNLRIRALAKEVVEVTKQKAFRRGQN